MKSFNSFCGQKNGYPLSKTLRFEIQPLGKTLENIEKNGLLKSDEIKARDYQDVKKILDNYNKYFIDDVLIHAHIDYWNELDVAIKDYRNPSKDKKVTKAALEKVQAKLRKCIRELFERDDRFKIVTASTPNGLFKKILPDFLKEESEAVNTFKKFSTYFTGFQENRQNVYSCEPIPTAVPYRIVNDNFPKFIQDRTLFLFIQEKCPQVISDTENELSEFLNGKKLADIFSIKSYNDYLSQKGIDFFNQVIGGISGKAGDAKKRGVNEFINLYWQQHADFAKDNRKVKMVVLFKQILSDRSTLSFIPAMYKDDDELKESISVFWKDQITGFVSQNTKKNVPTELDSLIASISQAYEKKIYINAKELTFVSQVLFGNWNELGSRMQAYAQKTMQPKKEWESWLKHDEYSFSELNTVLAYEYHDSDNSEISFAPTSVRMENYFEERQRTVYNQELHTYEKTNEITYESLTNLVKLIQEKYKTAVAVLDEKNTGIKLQETPEKVEVIKLFLDSMQDLMHRIKPLCVSADADRDANFYTAFDELYAQIAEIIPLYNKVRNYLTKKTLDPGKYKLNFDAPTLADGWDLNKEDSNACVLMMKGGMYYLGIMNTHDKPDFDKAKCEHNEGTYKKMIYKLLPGPNKMLPKVFFSTKGKETFNPPKNIFSGYEAGKFKKGDSFDIRFCHEIIDYFKGAIKQHPDWKNFGFKFSDTNSYEDISTFYKEIADQGYKLTFVDVSESVINEWVDSGKLYLFRIYNKDFAEGATGNPNMHTLYWKNLFSEENLKDIVLKLNGQAELFYRKAGIDKPIIHKAGTKVVNRTTVDGEPIPEALHDEIYRYVNGKLTGTLSSDAQSLLDKKLVTIKTVTHDITKDKHYTQEKFLFHVPLTINFKADGSHAYMNSRALEFLRKNEDVNIIGLDRGERNLIYLSLINCKGEIILQKSFNTVDSQRGGKTVSVDYHEKLDQREKERDAARRSWSAIGKIAELKEGYLSAVIHEITELLITYNAIVVMEDLNFGFKRGRFHVEKQVYQKFEKMLIDKLNYLVFKDKGYGEPGNVLNGYQLTEQFVSFQSMGKQSGFLFYVPAGYTSKIDPVTGFVNMFDLQNLTNVNKKHEFFSKFDSICYDSKTDSFAFSFDYKNFGGKAAEEMKRTAWIVYSKGDRIQYYPSTKESGNIHVTAELKKLFDEYKINWELGNDILDSILEHGADEAGLKERDTIKLYDRLYQLFKLVLQMRNSNAKTEQDYILSPVPDAAGMFYDSRNEKGKDAKLPIDADANGAYHIALKGLLLMNRLGAMPESDIKKTNLAISNADWFAFRQK
jgi:CRISPR-associated protein Cpf1